ncbi:hypothetical protein MP228_005238 [Amoeboaphelidium protococcarum]|nr:hypothetical protein MP228_005238 [Amoeboaphelidium protococcarum]
MIVEHITATSQTSRFAETDYGIDLKGVQIAVGERILLQDAHLQLNAGVHYGLLGRNGVGKSILLKCLASGILLSPNVRDQMRIMMISQTLDSDDNDEVVNQSDSNSITVQEEMLKTPFGWDWSVDEKTRWEHLAELRSRARGKEARQMAEKLGKMALDNSKTEPELQLLDDLDQVDPAKVKEVAKSLKITDEMMERPLSSLSGGWKMRVQLAKAILYQPDVLLLDEPTNHLDIAGIIWLQKAISSKLADITILMVSHNRSFLNAVAQRIVVFKNKQLEYYKGNYDQYIETITDKELYAERLQDQLDRKRAAMESSIKKNASDAKKRGDDKKMKQVASRKVKLEERTGVLRNEKGHRFKLNRDRVGYFDQKLGEVEHEQDELSQSKLKFSIPTPILPRFNGPLLVVEDVGFERKDKTGNILFKLESITFNVEAGECVAICGANGQGKSTLLNLIASQWHPSRGSINVRSNKVGYFKQDYVKELGKETDNAVTRLSKQYPEISQVQLRNHLGSFGLGANALAVDVPIGKLSGGQRVVYAFAELTLSSPSLLLLDEPNSHLDLDALEALSESLQKFEGGIVIVSHDVSFIQEVSTQIFWLSEGKLVQIEGEEIEKYASGLKGKKGKTKK